MFATVITNQPTRIVSTGSTSESSLAAAIAANGTGESYDTVPANRDLIETVERHGLPKAGEGYWSRYTINGNPFLNWSDFSPVTVHIFKMQTGKDTFAGRLGTYSGKNLAEAAAKAGRDYDLARGTGLVAVASPRELGNPCLTFPLMFDGDETADLEMVHRLRSGFARLPVETLTV